MEINYNKVVQAKPVQTETQKEVKQVVNNVNVVKKSALQNMVGNFIKNDVQRIKNYIVKDVIITMGKRLVSETLVNVVRMTFGQQPQTGGIVPMINPMGGMNYNNMYSGYNMPNMYNQGQTIPQVPAPSMHNTVYGYDRISFTTRQDAEVVLQNLKGIIQQVTVARVADLYSLCGVKHQFTDNNFGWVNLEAAVIYKSESGWMIKFPTPTALSTMIK